jgi:endonuclease/exonuclease/phosphatase family metal-dependent hydrolase
VSAKGESALRIMTFNVRGFYNADGPNAWNKRAGLNIATIREAAPHLIGFQEVNRANLKAYREYLPGYHYVAWPDYNNQAPYQFPAIFWKPELLIPVASDGFWLSETPDVYSASWDTDCVRSAAWVRLRSRVTGTCVLHLNTHLDHVSEQARVEGTQLILRVLRDLQTVDDLVIITGDFNTAIGGAAYRLYIGAGFADLYSAAGNDDTLRTFTYHGFEGESFRGSDSAPRRIDWILARRGDGGAVRVRSCEIVCTHAHPIYPSDHYPVVAEVDLE